MVMLRAAATYGVAVKSVTAGTVADATEKHQPGSRAPGTISERRRVYWVITTWFHEAGNGLPYEPENVRAPRARYGSLLNRRIGWTASGLPPSIGTTPRMIPTSRAV